MNAPSVSSDSDETLGVVNGWRMAGGGRREVDGGWRLAVGGWRVRLPRVNSHGGRAELGGEGQDKVLYRGVIIISWQYTFPRTNLGRCPTSTADTTSRLESICS